jgi:hypothetical protein
VDDTYTCLLNILDEEINIYKNILNIISSEYESFIARDYDAIYNHIKLKDSFYEKVVEFEGKREQEIVKIRASMPDKNIESLSDLIDNVNIPSVRESLALRRTTLRLLIDRIFEANEHSKLFLDRSRAVFGTIIDNIKKLANASRKNVYGNKGKLDEHKDTLNPLLLNKEA